jgi:hypothetical protein
MVGDMQTGYIIVPHNIGLCVGLCAELNARCNKTPSEWVRAFKMDSSGIASKPEY